MLVANNSQPLQDISVVIADSTSVTIKWSGQQSSPNDKIISEYDLSCTASSLSDYRQIHEVRVSNISTSIRWPWRSRVIPVWLLLPPCVVMPVPVLPPPSLQFCIGRHASCCTPSRQFLSSHLRHSSRCVRISIIPVLLSPHSSDLPSSVVTPVAVLHHSSEGLSST